MIQLHNSRFAGHLGREKTLKKIQSRFYWPGMSTVVSKLHVLPETEAKSRNREISYETHRRLSAVRCYCY